MTLPENLIASLSPIEREVLPHLADEKTVSEIAKDADIAQVEAMRACQFLSNKDVLALEAEEEVERVLTKRGKSVQEKYFPEKRLHEALDHEQNSWIKIEDVLQKAGLTHKEFGPAVKKLKEYGAIEVEGGRVRATHEKISQEAHDNVLKQLNKWQATLSRLDNLSPGERKDLLDRGFIEEKTTTTHRVFLTQTGKELAEANLDTEYEERVTSEMLKDGSWKDKQFRRYDVTTPVPPAQGGRKHPLTAVIEKIVDIFIEMGFQEMNGPWVETSFWCFDAMWIPQDHPSREVQDTFHLPYTGKLPDEELVQNVKDVQESGGDTSSTGYGYEWDPETAKQLILRTHTTATTYRYFGLEDVKTRERAKYFSVGRIFRNERVDATHLAEFHQVEGFVMADGLTLKHLMGYIKTFYAKMGIEDIKFKVTYNPYTESSLEAMYYDEERGDWIELINSGIFRPESLAPFGIDKPVVAWGLGVERLAMILYEKGTLKELVGPECDLEWLRTYTETRRRRDGHA